MSKLKEIKKKIQFAQQKWIEIEEETAQSPLYSKTNINNRKEKLKNFLKEIRVNIEDLLAHSHIIPFSILHLLNIKLFRGS